MSGGCPCCSHGSAPCPRCDEFLGCDDPRAPLPPPPHPPSPQPLSLSAGQTGAPQHFEVSCSALCWRFGQPCALFDSRRLKFRGAARSWANGEAAGSQQTTFPRSGGVTVTPADVTPVRRLCSECFNICLLSVSQVVCSRLGKGSSDVKTMGCGFQLADDCFCHSWMFKSTPALSVPSLWGGLSYRRPCGEKGTGSFKL